MKPLDIHITQGDSIHPDRYFATITDPEGTVEALSHDDLGTLMACVAYRVIAYKHDARRLAAA